MLIICILPHVIYSSDFVQGTDLLRFDRVTANILTKNYGPSTVCFRDHPRYRLSNQSLSLLNRILSGLCFRPGESGM